MRRSDMMDKINGHLSRHMRVMSLFMMVLAVVLLSGCGADEQIINNISEQTDSTQPVTLTLMGNQDWLVKPIVTKAVAMYEAHSGNRIELQALPIDTVDTLISKRVAIGEITDIVMHFGGTALSDMQPERNFVDMSDEAWVTNLTDAVRPRLMKDGKIYGLPLWEASISGTLYNKQIFNRLGLSVPSSQEEFFEVCEKLKQAGIVPVYLASKDVWPLLPQFGFDYAIAQTPNLVDALNTNQINLVDIPALHDVVDWYVTMHERGYFGDDSAGNNWDGLPDALYREEYAMVMAWDTYLYSDLEAKYPGASENFGLMPLFVGGSDAKLFEGPNAAMLMVNKNSKHGKESMEFIRFLTQPEILNEIYRDMKTGTYFKSVSTNAASPQYLEHKTYIDELTYPSITPFIIGYSQYEMGKWVQQAMIGSITTREALTKMDDYRTQVALNRNIPEFFELR